MCDCIFRLQDGTSDLGKRLFEAYEKKYGGEVQRIESENAVFLFGKDANVPVGFDLKIRLANGKNKKGKIIATYCPICGLNKDGEPAKD